MELVCSQCQSINRVAADKPAVLARCGRCKSPLFPQHPFELNVRNFDKHLQRDGLPLVVDFWAPWCGPCTMMAPQFELAAEKMKPRARLAKINTEQESELASRFRIQSIPTMVLFQGGHEKARQSGAMNANQIVQWVQSAGL